MQITAQYGISADRLTAVGYGEARPQRQRYERRCSRTDVIAAFLSAIKRLISF